MVTDKKRNCLLAGGFPTIQQVYSRPTGIAGKMAATIDPHATRIVVIQLLLSCPSDYASELLVSKYLGYVVAVDPRIPIRLNRDLSHNQTPVGFISCENAITNHLSAFRMLEVTCRSRFVATYGWFLSSSKNTSLPMQSSVVSANASS